MKVPNQRSLLLSLIPVAVLGIALIEVVGVRTSNSSRSSREESAQEEAAAALRSGRLRVERLVITNRTRLFKVLASELSQDREGVLLRMRNDYDKRITSFQLSYGIVTLKKELIYREADWIGPHQVYSFENEAEPELETRGIGVLALILEDGTSDGDRQAVKELRQYRSGIRIAINEFLPKLQRAIRSRKESLQSAIHDVRSETLGLPELPDASLPYYTRLGIHDQRWRIAEELRILAEDRQPGYDSLSLTKKQELQYGGLSRIVGTYERVLAALLVDSAHN